MVYEKLFYSQILYAICWSIDSGGHLYIFDRSDYVPQGNT